MYEGLWAYPAIALDGVQAAPINNYDIDVTCKARSTLLLFGTSQKARLNRRIN